MQTIEEYIHSFPPEIQEILNNIRKIVREGAPKATEHISYGMPTYKMKRNLIHFGAFKNHIGIYPTPSGIEEFEKRIQRYKFAKGSLRLPLNEEIPYDLISEIVKYRVEEEENHMKTKK